MAASSKYMHSLTNFYFCVGNSEQTTFLCHFHQAPYLASLLPCLYHVPSPQWSIYHLLSEWYLWIKSQVVSPFLLNLSSVFLLYLEQNLYSLPCLQSPTASGPADLRSYHFPSYLQSLHTGFLAILQNARLVFPSCSCQESPLLNASLHPGLYLEVILPSLSKPLI